jgi:hypothetical protein
VDVRDASQCGADIASRFAPPAFGLFLATPESDLAAKAFAVIGDHFPALVDVLLLVFEEVLLCQSVDCDCDNVTPGGFHADAKAFCFANNLVSSSILRGMISTRVSLRRPSLRDGGVREDSSGSALVLSQLASGAQSALAPNMEAAFLFIRTKLIAPWRRACENLEFQENVFAAVVEIQHTVLCDDFPVEPFLLPRIR